MSLPRLHVVIASTRPGRVGPAVADWFMATAREFDGFDTHLVDLADFDLPLFDEPHHPAQRLYTKQHTKDWSASVAAADAFVFVAPEYNFGMNAALKNALDFLYFEWQYKPVGCVSYGAVGAGLRAAQMTKQVVTTLKMVPVTEAVAIHFVGTHLAGDGRFGSTDILDQAAAAMLTELHKLAVVLAPLRDPGPDPDQAA
jgi:NAD(P)H-dependent FMN reductase